MFKNYKNLISFSVAFIFLVTPLGTEALSIDELKDRINNNNSRIEELNEEIKKHEQEIAETQTEKKTLNSAIGQIDITRKKLSTEIDITENKIEKTNYTLEELGIKIEDLNKKIEQNLEAISESMRKVQGEMARDPLEIILSGDTISDAFDDVEAIQQLQRNIRGHLDELRETKNQVEFEQSELRENQEELEDLKWQLSGQKEVADIARQEKETLLEVTQNKEELYRALLNEKVRQRQEFEAELRSFEAQLKTKIDPNRLPGKGEGVLKYPVSNPRITQYFGNTQFAQSGAYNGSGHNGIDFGIPTGTAIQSAESGVVLGHGNTDLGCPGGSYGKWILVKHDNGLASIYAHLSLIRVEKNQRVGRGETIGYSGNTGYSTGPHLHFGVYAAEGVQIGRLQRGDGSYSSCTAMPLSPLNGYLNPLDYL